MLCLHLKNHDPYFCLATEEYLLKNFADDIFMLWQSDNTIVVGKHQNLLAEINYPFVLKNNITVARRISGGGTVFHDAGNVNFAFIKSVNTPAEISFKMFTAPVVDALGNLNLKATTSGRNDLLIEGLKISGNAEHIFKNRVLHHGTLLFNSDLKNLGDAIKVLPGKYESRAVQSNRSQVANISSFLKPLISVNEFIQFLIDFQLQDKGAKMYELSDDDIQNIQKLSDDKFKTWDWNFGYSPKYSFQFDSEFEGNNLIVKLHAVKGYISEINLSGEYFPETLTWQLSENLVGKRHCFEDVKQGLQEVLGVVTDELVYAFF